MADNRRTSEYRKLLPLIAKASGDIGDDTVGEDVQALLQALEAHKTSADHDGRYYTESEIDNLLLGTVGNNITLTAGLGLTGGGDLSANRRFDVGAGNGITVGEDTVSVDLNYNFTWMGIHSFQNITYASSIMPHISDVYDLGSSASLWRNIWASELSAIVFAQYTQVLLGGWFTVSKGEGVLEAAVSTSATSILLDSSSVDIGDIIVFRGLSSTGNPQVEYMKITGKSGTTYSVTRNLDGSGANAWPAGSVYANYGTTGNGRIELNAYDTPRISVFSHANTIAGYREQVRIGDLINGWGYSTSTYGSAFGAYESGKANITIDPTNGVRIRNYNQTIIQLTGTEASFENVIKLGTYGRLQQGTGTWGSNFTGSAIWNESGIMNIGGWNNNVKQWWGGNDGALNAAAGDIRLDKDGIIITAPAVYSSPNRNNIKWYKESTLLFNVGMACSPYGDTYSKIITSGMSGKIADITIKSDAHGTGSLAKVSLVANDIDGSFSSLVLSQAGNAGNLSVEVDTANLEGNLVVDGTIKDGSGVEYLKSYGWIPVFDTWTYASATTITVPSGATSKYKVGQGVKLTQSGTVKYFYIVGVTNTMLTITGGTLVNATISDISYTNIPGPVFLTTPLTSTSWDGDSFSTTAKTKIDLSEVFGVPAGIKAVLVWVAVRDSGSQTKDCYFRLSPVSTGSAGMGVNCDYVNDRYGRHSLIVPCDANGDIYYQIEASGSGTMDVFLQIWGWWL